MNVTCRTCQSHEPIHTLCKDGHNQRSYPSNTPHCLRDDFPDAPWPWWLDEQGTPIKQEAK